MVTEAKGPGGWDTEGEGVCVGPTEAAFSTESCQLEKETLDLQEACSLGCCVGDKCPHPDASLRFPVS